MESIPEARLMHSSGSDAPWRLFRAASAMRVVVLASVLVALRLVPGAARSGAAQDAILALVGSDFVLTFVYYAWGKRHATRLGSLTITILMVEVGVVTIGLTLIRPEYAVYGLTLYLFLVVAAAALHSAVAGYAIAAVSALAYAATAVSVDLIAVVLPARHPAVTASLPAPRTSAIVNAITCVSFAVVAGALSEAMRSALARSRMLEERLRMMNQDLEARIQEAVRVLRATNESLAAKNNALGQTLHHVDLFARAVSHDLRNPITAAGESVRLAGEREGMGRTRLLALASENLLRADRMLVGLRDLMRAIGFPSAVAEIDLEGVVTEVIEELAASHGGSRLPVRIHKPLGTATGRKPELAVVFRNLIGNAVAHNRDDPALVIEVGREDLGDRSVLFVRDNGRGIAPELHKRIFEPFYRAEAGRDNLGLGLALVEAVVSHGGGHIWVESTVGGGATFYFTLPNGSPADRAT